MSVNGLLTSEDLEKIASLLEDGGYGTSDIMIVINVQSQGILDKINEDFFYRNNQEGTPPKVDEVKVSVGNVNFKYVVKDDGE